MPVETPMYTTLIMNQDEHIAHTCGWEPDYYAHAFPRNELFGTLCVKLLYYTMVFGAEIEGLCVA